MTQAELTKIWDMSVMGKPTGWAHVAADGLHILSRQVAPHETWARKNPDGVWEKAEPMRGPYV